MVDYTPIIPAPFRHPVAEAIESLRQDGYAYIPNFIDTGAVDAILKNLENDGHAYFNRNVPSGVFKGSQYFDTFALAKNRTVFSIICSQFVEIMCSIYLRDYILKCHRYYETYGDHVMHWHTDSKNQQQGVLTDHPGLVFIIYLTDTEYGEFQLVKGSHLPDTGIPYQEMYAPEQIRDNYQDRVVSLKGKRGSLVIQETRAIHRAKPMAEDGIDPNKVRKSLFFQIDSYPNNTEPVYTNPRWLDLNSVHQHKLFRFGRSDIPTENADPVTTIGNWNSSRFAIKC